MCLHSSVAVVSVCACVYEYVCFCVQAPVHLRACAAFALVCYGLQEPHSYHVSTDLASALSQRVLVPSALFRKCSQGVRQERITAEDGSMLSGLTQDKENELARAMKRLARRNKTKAVSHFILGV